jgi:hypothetical protein
VTIPRFDLGLSEADALAMAAARRRPQPFDRDSVLRMIEDSSSLVQAALRRRPLLEGEPFTLPGHEEH